MSVPRPLLWWRYTGGGHASPPHEVGWFDTGRALLELDGPGQRWHADALVRSGVGDVCDVAPFEDVVFLEPLLAGKRVSVSSYIGELFEGFRGSASPRDLETLFQLITLYATAPWLDPVYFSRYASSLRSVAETRAAQPDAIFYDTVNTVLSQEHLRARPLTLALLGELSLEQAEAVYADRFADLGDATFVFVGAFDWETLRALTVTYLAGSVRKIATCWFTRAGSTSRATRHARATESPVMLRRTSSTDTSTAFSSLACVSLMNAKPSR